MKFVVACKTLSAYASAVSRVINSKNALQILNNFFFTLDGEMLSITGSDTENALTATFEVIEAEGEGSFCIDARRLVDLLKMLPDQPLTVDINDDNYEVTISYPEGKYSMVAIPGDQFPQYEKEATEEQPMSFTISSEILAKGIDNTIFAIGTDDFHPQMMGICFDIHPDNITFVATDTRKLVRYINTLVQPGIELRCIVPLKPATVLRAILDKEGEVQVSTTSLSATFTINAYTFNCRFIKGRYPDYNRAIPTNNPYTLRVDRVRFLNSVRRVGVFVDPGYGMEKFRITEDHIELKSSDTSVQTAGNEHVDCEYQGPELVMGFSAPYLVEICSTLQTEEILLYLSGQSRPGVFCPSANEEGTELLMLLMPMNVVDF